MSRAGEEPKPMWRQVPLAVRRQVERALGAPVRRGARVWGGYAPSPTFRLRLADGRRVFFKGVADDHPNEVIPRALAQEARIYRQLGPLIAPCAPALYGEFHAAGWQVLLLEDLGPATIPPWTAGGVRRAARAYADFHRATLGRRLPRWLTGRQRWERVAGSWRQVASQPGGTEPVARLAGGAAAAGRTWLAAQLPVLLEVAGGLGRVRPPYALLHFDTRSDNIRLRGAELRIFDWPAAWSGPPELDAVAFAQSIPCEGGPAPERFLKSYAERLPLRERVVDQAVAAMAGFFAGRAWQPELPGLPRVRSIQRRQLKVCLAWAARRLGLPAPDWLSAVPD